METLLIEIEGITYQDGSSIRLHIAEIEGGVLIADHGRILEMEHPIQNEDELVEFLSEYGFEIVDGFMQVGLAGTVEDVLDSETGALEFVIQVLLNAELIISN